MATDPELLGDEPVRRSRGQEPARPSRGGEPVGGTRPRRRRARWVWWTLALVLAAGTGAAYADGLTRTHEARAVTACEHRLRVASAISDRRMGLVATYAQPAQRMTPGMRPLHLADLMAGRARRVLVRVQRADRACRSVSVRPWHFSLVARRNAATAYSGALVTLLQTVAAQGLASFHDDATLVRLRAAAGVD
jgi:hypothetical protein